MKIPNVKEKLTACIIFAVVLAVMIALKIPCPINKFAGIPCPGCGMTRAWLSALRLDFADAFRMHGMFWSVPLLVLYYLTDGRIFGKKADTVVLALICAGFLLNWICGLIL